MHEGWATSPLHSPLAALGAAYMKLMRIIPDNAPGYSDTFVTVKRYLLNGAASAFCAIVFRALSPFSPLHPCSGGKEIDLGLVWSNADSRSSRVYLSQMPTGKLSTDRKPMAW
jgi:hypothetical protein